MKVKLTCLGVITFLLFNYSFANELTYLPKSFVKAIDPAEFKNINPGTDGFVRTYTVSKTEIWEIENNAYTKTNISVMLCFEGRKKKGQKDGVFSVYVVDSADHKKRYKVAEQTYNNDKLDGESRTYTLSGKQVGYQTYKKDSLYGISKSFWVDGQTVTDEIEYLHGYGRYIKRSFYDNGKLCLEAPFEANRMAGVAKKFYSNGTLKEFAIFKEGQLNGVRRFFYPNAQLSMEEIYKEGKPWSVISSYAQDGFKRDAGTLFNGNGSILYYNENGTLKETKSYHNGVEK